MLSSDFGKPSTRYGAGSPAIAVVSSCVVIEAGTIFPCLIISDSLRPSSVSDSTALRSSTVAERYEPPTSAASLLQISSLPHASFPSTYTTAPVMAGAGGAAAALEAAPVAVLVLAGVEDGAGGWFAEPGAALAGTADGSFLTGSPSPPSSGSFDDDAPHPMALASQQNEDFVTDLGWLRAYPWTDRSVILAGHIVDTSCYNVYRLAAQYTRRQRLTTRWRPLRQRPKPKTTNRLVLYEELPLLPFDFGMAHAECMAHCRVSTECREEGGGGGSYGVGPRLPVPAVVELLHGELPPAAEPLRAPTPAS